jgi:LPS export ABC transporter protein LptC
MKRFEKYFRMAFAFLTLIVLLYGSYLLLRGADVTIPSLFRPPSGPRLIMSMEGFRFAESDKGRVSWRMHAGNADLYENKEAQLKGLDITFISPDNKEAVLSGDTGRMDTVTGNASIRRGTREVRVVTSDGYVLSTDSLFWRAGERLIRTADPFKLLGSEIYLEGKGFSANIDLRTLMVDGNVKAVLQE